MMKHLKTFGFLLILGFLTFSNGLSNPFVIDDHAFYEEKLLNIKFLPLHFLPDKNRALHIEGESRDPFYRPLATVVPMLSLLAFKNNTTGHHAVNLVLICLAAFGIYRFLLCLRASREMALLAASLFMIHPVNGVLVNYITASVFSVQIMLMLGALALMRPGVPAPPSVLRYVGACVLYLLSTWCHETAMFLPLYAFALEGVLNGNGFANLAALKTAARTAWRKTWPLFVMMALIIFVRTFFISALDESILGKIKQYHMTFPQFLATWTMLLAWYLSRLFWFQNVVLIMAHQPLTEHVGAWIMVLAGLLTLAGFLVWTLRRQTFILLGLVWFIIGFIPFTLACFFQPIHGLMIEPHWFLFPVVGFFMAIAAILAKALPPLAQGMPRTFAMLGRAAVIGVVACSVFFSRWHNWVWGDEVRYCTYWLEQSPSFVAVNAYIAKAYEFRQEFDKAREHYKIILGRGYKDEIAYTNLGLIDMQQGRWESARENLAKVIAMDPKASIAVNDMGVVYFNLKEYETALQYFDRARQLNPYMILPYLDMAKAYLQLHQQDSALHILEEAASIAPTNEFVMVELIQIYIARKDQANTVRMARMLLKYSQNPISLQNAGILFKQYGLPDEASAAVVKAQRIFALGRGRGPGV